MPRADRRRRRISAESAADPRYAGGRAVNDKGRPMTQVTRRAALALLGAGIGAPRLVTRASAKPIGEALFLDSLGVVIKGYDPVAFWENEESRKGNVDLAWETDTGTWWFAEEAHREMFIANPARYTPEFGGYDAEGMARGFKRRSDPTVWVLIDGKVYLHYTIEDQNRWAEDIRENIRQGEKNWERLKDI